MLHWIAAFLGGRRQHVLVNGSKSPWSPITRSIPQGNVLGPVLFVFYTNDMPDIVDSHIHIFADDTKIFGQMTAQSDHVTMQTYLRQLEAWTKKWQLRFNEEKCKVMHLGQYNHHYDYCGIVVVVCVQIECELKFDQQVEMIANTANKILGLIRRSFTYLHSPTMKKITHEPGQNYSRI